MLFLVGAKALNEFEQKRLIKKVNSQQTGNIKNLIAHFHYFVITSRVLNAAEQKKLQQVLPEVKPKEWPDADNDDGFWVLPRVGTLSPWCSKATDILHHCGLPEVVRVERAIYYQLESESEIAPKAFVDPLTESFLIKSSEVDHYFTVSAQPKAQQEVDLSQTGRAAMEQANTTLGLSLSAVEIDYLWEYYRTIGRNPTHAELMMFAQVNSEHCRHKIFNAEWHCDGEQKTRSLFSMIKNTYQQHPRNVVVAYHDNAAVLQGYDAHWFQSAMPSLAYSESIAASLIVFKVETHNHPTAISPFPGAATGSGGEIRDEGATGRGAKPKAGLCGFSVSHLDIPAMPQPWTMRIGKPMHIASALDIMLQAPIGASAFNNEFGRPNLAGYFRTFCQPSVGGADAQYVGYHKPIMIAGGIGAIQATLTEKKSLPPGTPLIVLGGPAFAIGLGGGSASSRVQSQSTATLDFSSVQRANPEMQRRAQEVINACCTADKNPILSIHDVGAGGLSNALPEIVADAGRGANIDLRSILSADPGLSPMEIWCNESQERYVIAVDQIYFDDFIAFCERERCPYCMVGHVDEAAHLTVDDTLSGNKVIDLPLSMLFEKMPKLSCADEAGLNSLQPIDCQSFTLEEALKRTLQYPCVASKRFLITIGDRSVGGLVVRDQMVGPWQVPVADVAVTSNDFVGIQGEALTMGERAPIAIIDSAASARMAVGEAITNIAAAPIESIERVSLSANWMAAANQTHQGQALYAAVEAIGMSLCPALGIAIPVGKDSLSMSSQWQQEDAAISVTSPLSVIISAAASVYDVTKTLTPMLINDPDTILLAIDLGASVNALGGSVLAQVYQQIGDQCPDVRDPVVLKSFFSVIQQLNKQGFILSYHDRSDGGLITTLCEMMFAGHCGVSIALNLADDEIFPYLFNEELGAVIQVNSSALAAVEAVFQQQHLQHTLSKIGSIRQDDHLVIENLQAVVLSQPRYRLQQWWEETSYHLQSMRDNPACALAEFNHFQQTDDPGLRTRLSFDVGSLKRTKLRSTAPKVAILREQGVNGHVEMAAAMHHAGFQPIDVHMTDLLAGADLTPYVGLVACGGFSYGDVLSAGRGWAQTILHHERLSAIFSQHFNRDDTFTLGVCNGCQMLSNLKDLIPGAACWPRFLRNTSEQFEARLVLVEVESSGSWFLDPMAGSVLPVVVSHAEGRVACNSAQAYQSLSQQVSLRYVDHQKVVTEQYPFNPNGSPAGIAGLTSVDGRATILMPHPERVFLSKQFSWLDPQLKTQYYSPWMKMFQSVYEKYQ